VSENKNAGSLHLYRSDHAVRLLDTKKFADLLKASRNYVTRHRRSKFETILRH
jgi:hypothetical protein